jgi:exopolysaccharide production negative regulator
MRTSNVALSVGLLGLALGFSPAVSFDGTPSEELAKAPPSQAQGVGRMPVIVPPMQARPDPGAPRPSASIPRRTAYPPAATEALRSGTQALREGRRDQAVTALEYAAEQGVPGAIWKLGQMYADGEGVDQNKLRAFEYFKNLTQRHAGDPPGTPQAPFIASAFVALGHFYLEGIQDTAVKPDPSVAHELFYYAASYFQDPEAQYELGRLYLDGIGTAKDAKQAVRWFGLAADKNHRSAQALLGSMLFKGQGVPRQAGKGLAWLTIAKEGAGSGDAWISESYRSAFAQATQDEQAMAYRFLEDLVRRRR